MLDRPVYMIQRALRNMRQSPFLCSASIGTVAVSLIIVAFFAMVVLNVEKMTEHWSREIQVTAYMDSVPPAGELDQRIRELRGLEEVQAVSYVSKKEAYERFQTRLAEGADILEGLDPEFLPASLEISLKEPYRTRQGVASVVAELQKNPALSDLRYDQEWLERFESFLRLLRIAAAVLGGFLLFAALFIISNTIRLTLYARRDELEVMALVGGTPMFIKAPFLLEGAMQGATGGVLALGGAWIFFEIFLQKGLRSLLLTSGVDQVTFLPGSYQLALLATGTFLGLFGSLTSLRKFVRI